MKLIPDMAKEITAEARARDRKLHHPFVKRARAFFMSAFHLVPSNPKPKPAT